MDMPNQQILFLRTCITISVKKPQLYSYFSKGHYKVSHAYHITITWHRMLTTLLSHDIRMPSTCLSHAIHHQIHIHFHSTKSHFISFHSTTFNNVIVALNCHPIFT
jgi:hypothetical protein